MKLFFISLLLFIAQASANIRSQTITLRFTDAPLEKVLAEVKKQSGYSFIANTKLLKEARKVTVKVTNAGLDETLRTILQDQSLYAEISKGMIYIKAKRAVPRPIVADVLQEIRGTVLNETGEPLVGATITIKSTNVGTQTDGGGNFSFPKLEKGTILVVSYTGYLQHEVIIGDEGKIEVVLKEDPEALEEVVIVAFGQQKRTDMVGSVTQVKPENLRIPSSNLTTALAGQAAGIIAYQRSGEPGMDNADFFIRGVTSFGTGKVDPLILIDGVEVGVTELARLRPDDIESFSIMKDATSTALYGARGANGVIYVTTKQGKEGPASISFRSEASYSAPTRNVDFADPVTYMKLYNEAQQSRFPLERPYYAREYIDATEKGEFPILFPQVDWREELFKKSTINHRHNLNVRGGGKVARYYVAGSYAQDNGVLKVDPVNNFNNNIDLKTYTLRANVNVDVTKSTELIVRLNGVFDDYNGPIPGGATLYNQVIRSSPVDFWPTYPKDADHDYVQHIMFGRPADPEKSFINPYANMVSGYKDYTRSVMMAQMELKQDLAFITPGLRFRSMFNTNRTSRFEINRSYKPFYYGMESMDRRTGEYTLRVFNESSGTEWLDYDAPNDPPGRVQNSIFYLESAVDYSRVFHEKHAVSALLVNILRSSLNSHAENLQVSLPSRNVGVSGRGTYAYDSRYYAEFNFGYNGSERFHESQRFGFFPSFGLAWSVSNEKFWTPWKDKIHKFRLRGTYGLVGNDQIGAAIDRFFYISEVQMDSNNRRYTFGQQSRRTLNGINVKRYANPDITWETSYKTNLAVELGLFNKVEIQADFFSEIRKNILMDRADIPTTMGLMADLKANVGEASGRGMDMSVDFSHSFSKQMWLQARGNFTYATNKYRVYEEPTYDKEWWKSHVGQPLNQPRGYIAERLFIDDDEVQNSPFQDFAGGSNIAGDIKYKDINGDGVINSLDEVPIGFPTIPQIIYGAGFSFGWKMLDVSAFFQGSAYSSFFVDPVAVQPFVGGKQILQAFADDHYSLSNPDIYALWPRLSTNNHSNNVQRSTWWLHNGNFLRLKQAEIGFSLSENMRSRLHAKTARFYVSGTNLFNLSHFKLWDSEMGGNGLGYPLQRVFNLGINVTF